VAAGLRFSARLSPRRESAQRLAAVASETDLSRRIAAAFEVFAPAQRRALLTPATRADTPPDAELEPVRRWLAGTEGLDSLNRLLYVDARLSLADDLLLGADKVSMANSVELRVPFLDLGYLGVAERIPGRLKISLGRGRKRLQQLVGRRLLPTALARSLVSPANGWRKKRGFDVPTGRWFGAGNLDGVLSLLAGPGATLLDYVRREAVVSLLNEHAAGRRDHTRRLVALLTLEAWHRAFIAGDLDAVARALGASEGTGV
jgi:asparagine synthase (glutamine-hydrolysing)